MTRYVPILAILILVGCTDMTEQTNEEKGKRAWARIESLGGHGVWESDMVVVSLKDTGLSDDDLPLFSDFPYVQILDLSSNPITDDALKYLDGLNSLESLIIVNTKISEAAVASFREAHPNVEVQTGPSPPTKINPFTGEPFED